MSWYKNELDINTRRSKSEDFLVKDYGAKEGINISTIHSSKGLEYDVVLCPYIGDQLKKLKNSRGPIWKNYQNKTIYINSGATILDDAEEMTDYKKQHYFNS